MKTLSKIAVMALALFMSNGLFAQQKSVGRGKAHIDRPSILPELMQGNKHG